MSAPRASDPESILAHDLASGEASQILAEQMRRWTGDQLLIFERLFQHDARSIISSRTVTWRCATRSVAPTINPTHLAKSAGIAGRRLHAFCRCRTGGQAPAARGELCRPLQPSAAVRHQPDPRRTTPHRGGADLRTQQGEDSCHPRAGGVTSAQYRRNWSRARLQGHAEVG